LEGILQPGAYRPYWQLLPKVQGNWSDAHRYSTRVLPVQALLQLPGAQQIQGIFKVRVHQQDIDSHIVRHITNIYIDNEYIDISTEFATFEAITELSINNNNNKIKIYNERIKKITRKNPRNYRKQTLECYGRNRL